MPPFRSIMEWSISGDQVEELAARLYFPPGKENHSLFAGTNWSDSFAEGLRFFRLLEEKDPEALRGDVNLYRAYNQVAPPGVDDSGLAPYWADFKVTLESLGGEEQPKEEKGVDEQVNRLFGPNDLKGPTMPMSHFDTALRFTISSWRVWRRRRPLPMSSSASPWASTPARCP